MRAVSHLRLVRGPGTSRDHQWRTGLGVVDDLAAQAEDVGDEVGGDVLVWLNARPDVDKTLPTYAGLKVAQQNRALYVAEINDGPS